MFNDKYVAYYRVSTHKQGISGLGLEAQQLAVTNHLKGCNPVLVKEFIEVETGKGANALDKRPQLKEALTACRKSGAILIIAKLDRLARNVHFISGLMESKVKFIACDLPEANELTLHVMAAFAEHEAKRISQRTKEALKMAKLRGVQLGKAGAYNLKPNIEMRQLKSKEFAEKLRSTIEGLKLQQLSQREIVHQLNSLNIKTARGGEWSLIQVQRLLKILNQKPVCLEFR